MNPTKTTLVYGLITAAALAMPAMAEDWQPSKPINIIVPWGAGGSTDQVTRATVPILEEHLGQSVVVVNQGGRRHRRSDLIRRHRHRHAQ